MDATAFKLAQTLCAMDMANTPAQAIAQAKVRLLDGIACAMGALNEPFCEKIAAFSSGYTGARRARIWGHGTQAGAEMAGFANGTALRYHDLNDTFLGASAGHPSDMIPALVALAEAEGCDGAALLLAIIAAYEAYCSLADATQLGPRGFDQATAAALGAAAGASRLLGLNAERMAQSFAIALSGHVALYNVRCGQLSDWKACAGPNGAKAGVFAALLAADDVTGPTGIFEGKGGLAAILGGLELKYAPAIEPRLLSTRLKAYPVCYHGQAAVDAAVELHKVLNGRTVTEVVIKTYAASALMMGGDESRWAPTTRETADHSLPYTVAITLLNGKLTSADYSADRLKDAHLRDFMKKIKVVENKDFSKSYPDATPVRVSVKTIDGTDIVVNRAQAKGHPDYPISEIELEQKLLGLWPADLLPLDKAHTLLNTISTLETQKDIGKLVDCLCR